MRTSKLSRGVLSVAAVAMAAGLVAGCATETEGPALSVGSSTPSRPASTCPAQLTAQDNSEVPKNLKFPSAPADTMVSGTPYHAAACRYLGMLDPNPGKLAKSKSLNATQAAQLAAALDKSTTWPKGVAYSCPADFGSWDLVVFDFRDSAPVDVLINTAGCGQALNGHRTAITSSAARGELEAMLGRATLPTDN